MSTCLKMMGRENRDHEYLYKCEANRFTVQMQSYRPNAKLHDSLQL